MKILAIADEESKYYWDYYKEGKLDDIDLIISCGDLEANYLEFLATFAKCPVLYVHGNHDQRYDQNPPGGCICIEDDIYVHEGIRILGLGGSMKYRDVNHQYTEGEMVGRVLRIGLKLLFHGGFDILVTHAPAHELNDGEDLPHRGFKVFRALLEQYKPKYFLHGHVHLSYSRKHSRYTKYNDTHVINAYERCVFEYEDENVSTHII